MTHEVGDLACPFGVELTIDEEHQLEIGGRRASGRETACDGARRMAEARKQKKSGKQFTGEGGQEADASSLKGRPNPNTSRKKARRRR